MLYKVTVGRDVYLGTPEEVVAFMAKADDAPSHVAGDLVTYMRGIATRVAIAKSGGSPGGADGDDARPSIDTSSALAFLHSLSAARLLRLEQRQESRGERVDPKSVLDEGPVAFDDSVSLDDLRRDVLDKP